MSRRTYDDAMREAIAVAQQAPAHGDVPIGAVLLDSAGALVATGRNTVERDGDATAHAEMHALREASRSLGDKFVGGTLVVTIEPCTMCAGAAVLARVDRIVFGAAEPKTGAVVSLWDVVRDPRLNHRIEVLGPWDLSEDVAAECGALLRTFFRTLR